MWKRLTLALICVMLCTTAAQALEARVDSSGGVYYTHDRAEDNAVLSESEPVQGGTVTVDCLSYRLLSESTAAVNSYTAETSSQLVIPDRISVNGAEYLVTEIAPKAFFSCQLLERVTVPEGVITIGDSAFENCSRLTSVSLPTTVGNVGENAFFGCMALTQIEVTAASAGIQPYYSDGGVLFRRRGDGDTLVQYPLGKQDTSYALPAGVTEIGPYSFALPRTYDSQQTALPLAEVNLSGVKTIDGKAFEHQSGLKKVTFGESVEAIANTAFSYTGLVEVNLPPTILHIAADAFSFCRSLRSIEIQGGSANGYTTDQGVLYGPAQWGAGKTALLAYPAAKAEDTYEILAGTNVIEGTAFDSPEALCNLTIPDSVTELRGIVFIGVSFNDLTIPGSIKEIQSYTFQNCSFQTLTLSEGLETIDGTAFFNCRVENIKIPSTVTKIGLNPFAGCSTLRNITVEEGNLNYTALNGVLLDSAMRTLVAYPAGSPNTSFQIPASMTEIAAGTLNAAVNLQTLEADENNQVFNVEDGVLYQGTMLHTYPRSKRDAEFTVKDGTTKIAKSAFEGNRFLEMVNLPLGLLEIGADAFVDCNNLRETVLPESLTTLSSRAFWGTALTHVTVPASVTVMGTQAFDLCRKLEYIEFRSPASQINLDIVSLYDPMLKYIYVPDGQLDAYKIMLSGDKLVNWAMVLEGQKPTRDGVVSLVEDVLAPDHTPTAEQITAAANAVQRLTAEETTALRDEQLIGLNALVKENYGDSVITRISAPTNVSADGLELASGVTEDPSDKVVSLHMEEVTNAAAAQASNALLELSCTYTVNNEVQPPRAPILITITCTSEMQAAADLKVIHLANSGWESVPFQFSPDKSTLTFRASQFSGYAVVHAADYPEDVTELAFQDANSVWVPSTVNSTDTLVVASYTDGQMLECHMYTGLSPGAVQNVTWNYTAERYRAFLLGNGRAPRCAAADWPAANP